MNVHLVLCWKWNTDSIIDGDKEQTDFKVLGAFSDEETANTYCDELQYKAFSNTSPGLFYWVETHEMNAIMIGEV